MGGCEIVFLFGLGVVYALAYRITENLLVLGGGGRRTVGGEEVEP